MYECCQKQKGIYPMIEDDKVQKFIFTTTSVMKVREFFTEHSELDPRKYKDSKGNNIVHHLCYHGEKQLLKQYIRLTKELLRRKTTDKHHEMLPNSHIRQWVNERNIQGFTPVLYAGFNGDIDMIRYLVEVGADIHATNNTKLNILILAAQSNRVSTFIYLKHKVDINLRDGKKSTALHWAAYNGSEEVVTYLLTLDGIRLNVRDEEGRTPMLVACEYGNTRIVRRLLMKGANRHIKNNEGKKAIDVARDQAFGSLVKILDDDYSCLDFLKFYYNVKVDYRPRQRSLLMPIVFFLTTFSCLLILHGLVKITHQIATAIQCIVLALMAITYVSLLRGPKRGRQGSIDTFLRNPEGVCLECVRERPRRSYHCEVCRTCIEHYDHHCTWINNCVGKQNIGRFLLFLLLLLAALAFSGTISALSFYVILTHQPQYLSSFLSPREHHPIHSPLWCAQLALLAVNTVICFFFFPVFVLFCIQLKNILTNQTSYERLRGAYSPVKSTSKRKKKTHLIRNCQAMCGEARSSSSSRTSFQELQEEFFRK